MIISKLEVAVRQLDSAIRLFLDEDYVSALTLAGAAEEILGKLCERAGLPVAVDAIIEFHWGETDPSLPDVKRKQILSRILNSSRNEAKHANDPDQQDFNVDPDSPLQMIMRAMPMARSLRSPPSREGEMINYIRRNLK